MPIQAVQHIRRMRGGAQSHLMRCADGHYYVVKFQNNPQHTRVLVNDWLGTRLAEMIGLPSRVVTSAKLPAPIGTRKSFCRKGTREGSFWWEFLPIRWNR